MRAAIFPGQGAQLVGMGRDVFESQSTARDTYAEADDILGFPLSSLCFEGPAEKLNATDIQQPAIFVTSVALFRAAAATDAIQPERYVAMAGLSLGEYTALHLAGAITFADAVRLVYRRGQLMQQAAEQSAGGMVSLMGMDESQALALCESVKASGEVRPANYNCPGQIVISGDAAACEAATKAVDEFGGKAIPLKVAGAFHSKLMKPAADALREALDKADIHPPKVRVISNVDVRDHQSPDDIRESLYRQVFNPVRWQACVEKLIADGVTEFHEIGPNRVLAGLNRKIDRSVKTVNYSNAEQLAAPASSA